MDVNIRQVVNKLSNKICFLDPLFECVSNSLEANATIINIDLFESEVLDDAMIGDIEGFRITDNGEGFTDKNLIAFNECYTENKRHIGCQGLGRFTWLKVFKTVNISSYLKNENKNIKFIFNDAFSKESVEVQEDLDIKQNKTIIEMKDKELLFQKNKKENYSADVDVLKEKILEKFFIKLFFMKEKDIKFSIKIKNHLKIASITHEDIIKVLCKSFTIESLEKEVFNFNAYYYFCDDNRNKKEIYLCAGDRVEIALDQKRLNMTLKLPKEGSFKCFVCGNYLDERINSERNSFTFNDKDEEVDFINPLSKDAIIKKIEEIIQDILLDKFPEIEKVNEKERQKAIEEAPYLSTYINDNKWILSDYKSIKEQAEKTFEKEKKSISKKYIDALNDAFINPKEFEHATSEYSKIASIELAHYICYRDAIIKGLKKLLDNGKLEEEVFHNILIKKRTSAINGEYLKQNLWLIDDKFMSFVRVYSDRSISRINNQLNNLDERLSEYLKRPDVFIVFNRSEDKKYDAIVIELKGSNCSEDEKNKSITELPNNILSLREAMPNILTIHGYIITTIDTKFSKTLKSNDFKEYKYIDEDKNTYFKYLTNINSHIYVYDYENLIKEAGDRNNTFIEILKGKY